MTYKPWPTADQQQQEAGRTDVVGNFVLNPATGQPYDSNNPMPVGATLTPPANQRVNAQAGDFVDGAIATVGAQADTAATSDTGTFSLIAFVKRLLQSLTTGNTNTSNTSTVLGATTDAAVTGDTTGTISAKQRGLTKILADVWDSTNHLLAHNIKQIGGQTPTLDNTTILATSMRGKGAGTAGDTPFLLNSDGGLYTTDWIRYQVLQGRAFCATTGQIASATNANLIGGAGLFNNSTAKKFLIYSIRLALSNAAMVNQINFTTADPAFGTAFSASNLSPGSGTTSLATLSTMAAGFTTGVSQIGTLVDFTAGGGGSQFVELLNNNTILYLPNGAANGIALYNKMVAAGNSYAITFKWVEI